MKIAFIIQLKLRYFFISGLRLVCEKEINFWWINYERRYLILMFGGNLNLPHTLSRVLELPIDLIFSHCVAGKIKTWVYDSSCVIWLKFFSDWIIGFKYPICEESSLNDKLILIHHHLTFNKNLIYFLSFFNFHLPLLLVAFFFFLLEKEMI